MSEWRSRPRPRLFLDTNTLVSAMAFRGPERWLLRLAARGDIVVLVSPYVIAECTRVLTTRFATPSDVVAESLAALQVSIVSEPGDIMVAEARATVRDPDDAPVLAAAWQAGADALVTGDKDLHAADQDRVRVMRTAEALAWVASAQTPEQTPP